MIAVLHRDGSGSGGPWKSSSNLWTTPKLPVFPLTCGFWFDTRSVFPLEANPAVPLAFKFLNPLCSISTIQHSVYFSHCIQFIHVVKCPTGVHHLQQQSFYRPILLALNFFIIDDDGDDHPSQRLAGMQRSTQRSTSEIFSSFGKTFPRAAGRQKGNNPVSIMMYNHYHAVEEADQKTVLCKVYHAS